MKTFTSVEEVLEDVERVINSIDAEDAVFAIEGTSSYAAHTPSRKKTGSSNDYENEAAEENPAVTLEEAKKKNRRPERRKPADMPKRPLSAYNLFFRVERERLLNGNANDVVNPRDIDRLVISTQDGEKKKRIHRKTHGRIAFTELARIISRRWKNLPQESKDIFERHANKERLIYKKELEAWQKSKGITRAESSDESSQSPTPTKVPVAAKTESLNSMMRRARSYMQYQAVLEQKQAELRLRQSMLDHMHMMLSYTAEGYPVSEGATYTYQPEAVAPGYYEMADATFQMAQMTLPSPGLTQQMQLSCQPSPTWTVDHFDYTQLPTPTPHVQVHDTQNTSPTMHWVSPLASQMPVDQERTFVYTHMTVPSTEFVRPNASPSINTRTSVSRTMNPTITELRAPQDDGPVPFDFEEGLEFNDGLPLESVGFADPFGS